MCEQFVMLIIMNCTFGIVSYFTQLFKTHMDYMEKTKMVMGADRIMEMQNTGRGK